MESEPRPYRSLAASLISTVRPTFAQSADRMEPWEFPQSTEAQTANTTETGASATHHHLVPGGLDSNEGDILRAGASGRRAIMLTGYWPPTNEMVRRFSTNLIQNPLGWIGSNWEGRGYDIYAYFPEFNPPMCSNCGKGTGILQVDYQNTAVDFFNLANPLQPIAVITFSRGAFNASWEVELNQINRSTWVPDYCPPTMPTPAPPDPTVPAGTIRLSTLPINNIVTAVNNAMLGVFAFPCTAGDGGGFLSEFIAYHGVWYQSMHNTPGTPDYCVAAGHVHVGGVIPWATATLAAEVTLRTVIDYVDTIVPPGGSVGSCGAGAVNAGCGPTEDTVFVNGGTGGPTRTVHLNLNSPFTLSAIEPSSMQNNGQPTNICLYGWLGCPGPADDVSIGVFGNMCFGPFATATQPPFVIWNSIVGADAILGSHTPGWPLPIIPDNGSHVFFSLPLGLGAAATVTFQGITE